MKSLVNFLREAKSELNKIVWPSWDQVSRSTVVVLITVIIITGFIFCADYVIDLFFQKVL